MDPTESLLFQFFVRTSASVMNQNDKFKMVYTKTIYGMDELSTGLEVGWPSVWNCSNCGDFEICDA
jgi:hypothetical protein